MTISGEAEDGHWYSCMIKQRRERKGDSTSHDEVTQLSDNLRSSLILQPGNSIFSIEGTLTKHNTLAFTVTFNFRPGI